MRSGLPALILAGMTCIAAATPARAVICYVIYDKSENIIYQSTYPPMDMSNAGYPERDALRARGEHLTFGDVDKCPTVVFLTGAGGTSDLRVDEVVAGMSARNIPGTQSTGTPVSGSPGSARAPSARTPAAASAPAAKPRSY
jgi:hypothetical protein